MKKILIIDDDIHIGDMLEEVLTKENYQVLRAYSGTESLLLLSTNKVDLVLLDLMLPGLSGEEILPKINDVPVIVISAKIDIDNKIDLLFNGAVDYLTKPFNIKELLARILIHLRNNQITNNKMLTFEDLSLDLTLQNAFINDKKIKLTRTEFAILKLLMQNKNTVVTKSAILDKISLDTPDCTESSLKIHISNLRKKLRNISENDYIEAVWGIGFKLNTKTN